MRRLVLIAAAIWIALTASAHDFVYKHLKYTITDREAKTCRIDGVSYNSWNWSGWDETMPSEVTDGETTYTVTAIGEGAFAGRWWDRGKEVKIPSTVTQIGKKAFMGCLLDSISLPEHLTEIADSVFYETWSEWAVVAMTIPDGVKRIGTRAFYNCNGRDTITLPESVTEIGEAAFCRYRGITTLNLPRLSEVSDSMLYACEMVTSIKLPDSLRSIGRAAFAVTHIEEIKLPDSLKYLGAGAFDRANRLSQITIPESVTEIQDSTFRRCSNLKYVKLPPRLEKIGNNAFEEVPLTSIELPNSLLSIGNRAFAKTRITSLHLPDGILSIGNRAFYECNLLTSVNLPESLTTIGREAFYGSSITSLTLPRSMTHIGERAFAYLRQLKTVEFPPNLKGIGKYAFQNCGLTDLKLPPSATQLASGAFYGCNEMRSVSLPPNLTVISDSLFISCTSLQEINIPQTVSFIGRAAFFGCAFEGSFRLPDNVKEIGQVAFSRCDELESFEIADTNPCYCVVDGVLFNKDMTMLHTYPCAKKGAYTIPSSVTEIGYMAFLGCSALDNVTLPDGLKIIPPYAFCDCMALNEIVFPESLEEIETYAFASTPLKRVILPESCPILGSGCFRGNPALEQVWIPGNIKVSYEFSTYASPFRDCENIKEVYFLPEHIEELDNEPNLFDSKVEESATLYVRASAYEEAQILSNWRWFKHIEIYEGSDLPGSVTDIFADSDDDQPVEIYTLDGLRVSDSATNLRPGIYILRKGNKTQKIIIK